MERKRGSRGTYETSEPRLCQKLSLQSDGHKADSGAEVKARMQICMKVCDVGGHSKPRESRRGVQEGSVSRAEQREGLRRRAARACACAPVRPRSSSRPHRGTTPWESAAGGQPRGPVAQPERASGPSLDAAEARLILASFSDDVIIIKERYMRRAVIPGSKARSQLKKKQFPGETDDTATARTPEANNTYTQLMRQVILEIF